MPVSKSRLEKSAPRSNDENAGRYRIQAVAEMTGVSAATLRAWERRYGIPVPKRTSSAYRLYSEHDVELVLEVRKLCAGGMAPSQAAREVIASTQASTPAPPIAPPDSDGYQLATARILHAIERFDASAVERTIKQSLFLGPAVTVFDRVLAPTLDEVGRRWERGTLSVSQEHLAAEIIGNAVRHVLGLVQPENSDRSVLLACFADEEHVAPLYGIALRFAQWGFRTVMLGARTPTRALREAALQLDPDIVGLSLTITPPAYRARELVDGYAEACGSRPWIVGGNAIRDIGELVQARGGGIANGSLAETRELVERMLAARQAASQAPTSR